MKYQIHELSRTYVRTFIHFLAKVGIESSSSDAFELLCYSLKTLCGLEVVEYNSIIAKYGEKSIKSLSKIKRVKLKLDDLTLEEKVALVECSKIYLSIILQGIENPL